MPYKQPRRLTFLKCSFQGHVLLCSASPTALHRKGAQASPKVQGRSSRSSSDKLLPALGHLTAALRNAQHRIQHDVGPLLVVQPPDPPNQGYLHRPGSLLVHMGQAGMVLFQHPERQDGASLILRCLVACSSTMHSASMLKARE